MTLKNGRNFLSGAFLSWTASAANLKQIGVACITYATDNQNKMPASFDVLTKAGIIENPEVLKNPLLKKHFAEGDYVLVPVPTISLPTSSILAYERYPEGKIPPEGLNAVFLDGHVEWLNPQLFQQALDKTLKSIDAAKAGGAPNP